MPRYKLILEYDGMNFCGWQRQKEGIPTVQGAIEQAFFKFCGEEPTLMGAGRTDQGVHALGQVAHVDLVKSFLPHKIQDALNAYLLSKGVVVVQVEEVDRSFHARFSASSRTYLYRIGNRRASFPLEKDRLWHVISPLDIEAMQEAANFLLGRHNFSSFHAAGKEEVSLIKTLDRFTIRREEDYILAFVESKSFLHNQVRIMMGTLKQVGLGEWPPEKVKEILLAQDRRYAGMTAPPYGLYLLKVGYDTK